jgi:hypothetical protein
MPQETMNMLETRCKNIYGKLSSLLFWEWDERFNIPLAEIAKEQSEKIQDILSKEFDLHWDAKTIGDSAKPIKSLVKALGGIREQQMLFATDPEAEVILFATWWPWGNGQKVSIRVGLWTHTKMTVSSIDLTMSIKRWFGLE